MHNRRRAISVILAAVFALAAPVALAGPVVGKPAPNFTIRPIGGKTVRLADLKGQIIVINRWATWCAPCREEMPMFDAVHPVLQSRGVQIYGVLINDTPDSRAMYRVSKLVRYPLARGMSGDYPAINGAVPTNYIIDRKGMVRYAKAGSWSREEFADIIVPLINEGL